MDTKFIKLSSTSINIPNWSNFFRAADAWLMSLQILEDNKNETSWGVFYVIRWIVAFNLELFVKAIAAHEDNLFNGNKYRHKTTNILNDYKSKIKIFKEITNDKKLFGLIKEYEKTIDTKFGETSVSIDGKDQKMMIDVLYRLRKEICERTGLH